MAGSKRKRSSRRLLIFIVIVVGGISIAALMIAMNGRRDNEKKTELAGVNYAETITPNAYGNFLAAAVKGFYAGGSINGVTAPAHNYYPSVADIKNEKWTKKNMPLGTKINELIASGEITYEPQGCKADKPSGKQNGCTAFIIKSREKTIFDSMK